MSNSTQTLIVTSSDDSWDGNDAIHYVAFGSQWVSIIGSLYIIVASALKWSKFQSPMQRMPMYLSIADFSFTTSHFIDHLIILLSRKYPTWPLCQTFAFIFEFFSMATVFNVLSVSLYCYVAVRELQPPDMGAYDWKLLSFSYGIPLILALIPLCAGYYGHDVAWCWIKHTEPNAAFGFATLPFLLVLILNCFALVMIFFEMSKTGHSTQQNKKILLRRSILFVVAYVFQFTPIVVMSIQIYVGQDIPFNTVLFVVFNTNLGGFLNVIAYGLPNLSRSKYTEDGSKISLAGQNGTVIKIKTHISNISMEESPIMKHKQLYTDEISPSAPTPVKQKRPLLADHVIKIHQVAPEQTQAFQ